MKRTFIPILAASAAFIPLVGAISCGTNLPEAINTNKIIDHQTSILGAQVKDNPSSLGTQGTLTLFRQDTLDWNLDHDIETLFTNREDFNEQNQILHWVQDFDPTKVETYSLTLEKANHDLIYQLSVEIIDPAVTEDGLYLLAPFYSGELKNNDGTHTTSNKDIMPIGINNGWAYESIVMLEDNDAFFMLYDQDQTDGLTIDNFIETIYFQDTSIMGNNGISTLNETNGNTFIAESSYEQNTYIPFQADHTLNEYYGSQLLDAQEPFMTSLAKVETFYADQPEVQKAIFQYYGYQQTKDANGNYLIDKTIENPASKTQPTFQQEPILTYEKVGASAIKITYHFANTWMQKGAKMVIKDLTTNTYNQYGSFALGNEAIWDKYQTDNASFKFVGYHQED